MEKGVPIRSVSRSIAVLQAINHGGGLTMMEIAQEIGVPYATAMRLVQTLVVEGLIEREPDRKVYRPTVLVRSLAHGYQAENHLVTTARPHLVALTRKVSWPATIATRVGQRMMVRASTHTLTSMTFNNLYPGHTRPLLECATGRCYLAFCPDDEREKILAGLRDVDPEVLPGADTLPYFESGEMVRQIRAQGYAVINRSTFTETPGKTSSIAVPVLDRGVLMACINLIFFSSTFREGKAVGLFLGDLQNTASAITTNWERGFI